jgi:hypothetical protein
MRSFLSLTERVRLNQVDLPSFRDRGGPAQAAKETDGSNAQMGSVFQLGHRVLLFAAC